MSGMGSVCGYSCFDFNAFQDENWEGKKIGTGVSCDSNRCAEDGQTQIHKGNSTSPFIISCGPKTKQGKMEKSFFSFKAAHPKSWKCHASGQKLIDEMIKYKHDEALALKAKERKLHIDAASRQLETLRLLEKTKNRDVDANRRKANQQDHSIFHINEHYVRLFNDHETQVEQNDNDCDENFTVRNQNETHINTADGATSSLNFPDLVKFDDGSDNITNFPNQVGQTNKLSINEQEVVKISPEKLTGIHSITKNQLHLSQVPDIKVYHSSLVNSSDQSISQNSDLSLPSPSEENFPFASNFENGDISAKSIVAQSSTCPLSENKYSALDQSASVLHYDDMGLSMKLKRILDEPFASMASEVYDPVETFNLRNCSSLGLSSRDFSLNNSPVETTVSQYLCLERYHQLKKQQAELSACHRDSVT
eukprot:CAMPEP_0171308872 /NCGR_PEP_ID=MMETSP0816-20121228/18993_1 /TAXON_ID=420281 /ORGANISM="Proboscia inermis, Strain CCAP1064/1" /LENGTH=421 /DNA_ID=CAMNT_0011792047 /DNA_START=605 /DNA_END=1870 /DNA_ORIENTATION=-